MKWSKKYVWYLLRDVNTIYHTAICNNYVIYLLDLMLWRYIKYIISILTLSTVVGGTAVHSLHVTDRILMSSKVPNYMY